MNQDEQLGESYRVEADPDSVRFILPRRPARTGGLVAIVFGLVFAGFASFWMLGVLGLLDPLFESIFEMPQAPSQHFEHDEDDLKSGSEPLETPATSADPIETPAPTPAKAKPQLPPEFEKMQKQFEEDASGFDIGGVFMALFGIPFLLIGLAVIFAGVLLLVGHAEILLTDQMITSIHRAGPLRRTQTRIASELMKMEIGRSSLLQNVDAESNNRIRARSGYVYNAIHAHFKSEAVLQLGSGQPLPLLRRLAHEIAQEMARLTDQRAVEVTEPHHAAEALEANEPYVAEYVPQKPASTKAVLDQMGSGITLRVPPLGFTKATLPLMLFSLFWCGFVALFTVIMFFTGVPLGFYLFISIFWAVGILVLLLGLNMMRKQAVIDVVHDTLLLTQQSIFGRKMHEWRRDELLDIRVDHSGTSVNNRSLMNLQFVPRDGKVVALFTGRDDDELNWMAAHLRTAMQIRKQD